MIVNGQLLVLATSVPQGDWIDDKETHEVRIGDQAYYVPDPNVRAFIAAASAPKVIEMIERVFNLEAELDIAKGPHCTHCGNAIDPAWCHCGSAIAGHGTGDGHAPIPMGCICGYPEPDWQTLARSRGEQLVRQRIEIARLTAVLKGAQANAEHSERRASTLAAVRDRACDLAVEACFLIPAGRITVDEKNQRDELHARSIRLRETDAIEEERRHG